jgi:hypothetical protein
MGMFSIAIQFSILMSNSKNVKLTSCMSYIYDVISCLCITILFYSHDVFEFDVSYSMFWIIIITPWPQSTSELYRPSDHRLSAKLVPTFCGWSVPRGQRDESLRPYSRISRPKPLLLLQNSSSVALTRLGGLRSRPITFLLCAGNRTRDLRICSHEL